MVRDEHLEVETWWNTWFHLQENVLGGSFRSPGAVIQLVCGRRMKRVKVDPKDPTLGWL